MPRYRATRQGFDGKAIREAGEEFDYDGPAGSWLEPVEDPEAKPAKPNKPKQ